ncbi:hypothetical protein NEFER03_1477 [Nematocida sp. LUAm3]|nr:hypothetical protein NEFER03_1477 [Nematocida sp. LUAm3]KAI5174693.1 hypothetical protein NEFER02_0803 [Nematocida sp. LUAm2]KAI5177896.1 hypothetical protein NEFER01_1098 [Nematocida sp. LUAm1]
MLSRNTLEQISRAEDMNMEILISGAPYSLKEPAYHLDVVDAGEGEPFTLETFKKSILESLKAGKDYILAKVTTADPNDHSSLYSYYYSAFEINKILFKYETARHLLHRMKVRNPMNNMYIMGQVYYYKITLEALEHCLQEYDHPSEESIKGCSKAFTAPPVYLENSSVEREEEPLLPKEHQARTISKDIFKSLAKPLEVKESRENKLRIRASYFANDGDFLVRSQIREYFRQNSVSKDDYFIFELERAQNDLLALMESPDNSDSAGNVETWRRALTAHLSFILVILCLLLFLGVTPAIFFVVFPLAVFFIISMLGSILYLFLWRRQTFGTIDVEEVDEI